MITIKEVITEILCSDIASEIITNNTEKYITKDFVYTCNKKINHSLKEKFNTTNIDFLFYIKEELFLEPKQTFISFYFN